MSDRDGGELSPIKEKALASFVMMNADLEAIGPVPLTKMTGLRTSDNLKAFKSASSGIKAATVALGQFMGENEEETKYLFFIATSFELVAAAGEAYAALVALYNGKALAYIVEGVGIIVGEAMTVIGAPRALALAGAAVGGAIAYNEWITSTMRQADVTVDLEGYDPIGQIKQALAAQGIEL